MSTINQAEYLAWNGESGRRWIADADRRDRVLRPMSEALLEACRLQPGEAVLDIGCGCGALSLAASALVDQRGSVLGVDISEVMLSVARQRAADYNSGGVAFLAADAQTHAFETSRYDVVISRFGTMFFEDPLTAFANIAAALRPGGRLCFVSWQPLAANDWLTVPGAALLEYGDLPDSEDHRPGMFAQSDAASVTTQLQGAGFSEVSVEPRTIPMILGADPEEATDYLADTGAARSILATIPERQPDALAAARQILKEYQGRRGVVLDAGILIVSAVRTDSGP